MHQPSAPWPSMKKIQSISLSEKNSGEYRNIYCLIESLSCAKINLFSSTIIAKNWKHGCASIAVFLSTSIAENWNLVFQAIFFKFLLQSTSFCFSSSKRLLYRLLQYSHVSIDAFCFSFLKKDFDTFREPLFQAFLCFLDNIQWIFLYMRKKIIHKKFIFL